MSDDDSWGAESVEEKKTELADVPKIGRGQQVNSVIEDKPKEEPVEAEKQEVEQDEWVIGGKEDKDKSKQSEQGAKVEKECSQIIPGGELIADKKSESWAQEEAVEENNRPRRGNRGNRDNFNDNERRTSGRDYNNHEQGDGFQRRGNRGNRNFNDNQGYRGGRNDNQGGFRGNKNYNREGREDGGGFNHRDREDRGGRWDRGEGGYRGGNGFRRNRDENGQYQRGDREGRGDYRGRGRGGYRGPRNDQEGRHQIQDNASQQSATVVPQNAVPQGRKCWPECSIYLLGKKMTLSFRQLHQFPVQMLVVPYITLKFELYPGHIVNNSPIRYKEKLASKHTKGQMNKPGDVYIQKAKNLGAFEAVAFLKVDENDQAGSFKKGVKQVLNLAERITNSNQSTKIESILFPIGPGVDNPSSVLEPLLTHTEESAKIKEIYIGCNDQNYFLGSICSFHDQLKRLFDENEVCKE